MKKLAVVGVVLIAVGIGGAAVVSTTASDSPSTTPGPVFGTGSSPVGNPLEDDGVWIVGEQIQPGEYLATPDNEYGGYWSRCSAVQCDPFDVANPSVIVNEAVSGPSYLVIEPTDVAVELHAVTLEGPR